MPAFICRLGAYVPYYAADSPHLSSSYMFWLHTSLNVQVGPHDGSSQTSYCPPMNSRTMFVKAVSPICTPQRRSE